MSKKSNKSFLLTLFKRTLALSTALSIGILSGCSNTGEAEVASTPASSTVTSSVDPSELLDISTKTDTEPFNPGAPFGEKYDNIDFGKEGDELYHLILQDFWLARNSKAYEYKQDYRQTAFLWPYGSFLEAQSAYLKRNPNDSNAKNTYIASLEALDTYYKSERPDELLSYTCTHDPKAEVFYDDNAWIALEFLTAHQLLGDDQYLTKAKELCKFLYSGWDDEIGGGIWWKEGLKEDKNGFTNSPVAVLSAMLYNITKDKDYLEWAKKIYDWVQTNLRAESGLIYDSIKADGSMNKLHFSYTTGTAISAGVELYRVTGDENYLNQAKQSAAAAIEGMGSFDEAEGIYIFSVDFPNWHGWLLDSFLRLHEFAEKEANDGVVIFKYALGRALTRPARYEDGYFIVNWNSSTSDKKVDLLHQAGTARCLLEVDNFMNKR